MRVVVAVALLALAPSAVAAAFEDGLGHDVCLAGDTDCGAGAGDDLVLLQTSVTKQAPTPLSLESASSAATPVSLQSSNASAPPAKLASGLAPAKSLPGVAPSAPAAEGASLVQGAILVQKASTLSGALSLLASQTQWNGDLFHGGDADTFPHHDGDMGFAFFTADSKSEWLMLLIAVGILVVLDFAVIKRIPASPLNHCLILMFWIAAGAVYMVLVIKRQGADKGVEWLSGYLLEWMLSIDNLFVFHLVFKLYATPPEYLHKALFLGIIGAVLFRMVFFIALATLMSALVWLRMLLGIFLIFSGIQTAREDEDEETDPSDTCALKALKGCLGKRLSATYLGNGDIFSRDPVSGKMCATLLFLVVCCLEVTDILFAVDSVSAKVAQIPDPYLCYSSSVLAMFGLRAMFFIIRDMIEYFELLKYGLCLILVFIGIELVLANQLHLPSSAILVVIAATFSICIAGSAIRNAKQNKLREADEEEAADRKVMENCPRFPEKGFADDDEKGKIAVPWAAKVAKNI